MWKTVLISIFCGSFIKCFVFLDLSLKLFSLIAWRYYFLSPSLVCFRIGLSKPRIEVSSLVDVFLWNLFLVLLVRLMFAKQVRGTCDKSIVLYEDRFAFVCCCFVFMETWLSLVWRKFKDKGVSWFYFLYFISVV